MGQGGVAFAEGGEVPETISVTGKQYKDRRRNWLDSDFVHSCGCKHKAGKAARLTQSKTFCIPRYDKGGSAGSK